MLNGDGGHTTHEKFRELCALADSGSLTPLEVSELRIHIGRCKACREVLREYRALATEGMGTLAAIYAGQREAVAWDETPTRQRLLERVRVEQQGNPKSNTPPNRVVQPNFLRNLTARPLVRTALAACLMLAVGYGGYRVGLRMHVPASAGPASVSPADDQLQKLSDDKKAVEELLEARARAVTELARQSSEKEQELKKLRLDLRALEDRSKDLALANGQTKERLEALSQQKELLNAQLQTEAQAFEKDRAELAKLRAERDGTLLRTASLEARNNELATTNREQERRLKDAEQYLSSDRDIRELMGARKLYIADVFDVDGSSRTQRPFGRVFYTQGKSLIFYAFDLDRQTKVLNASSFQVWGQHEAPQGQQVSPMNLGILYMDNEANRRWVMRFDDPKQLAEIDAVFVTVEPHGGSQKPTSKPFLYALLRNEANHP
jgi:hypothetical protein